MYSGEKFSKTWVFKHELSRLGDSKANSETEVVVKIAKEIMKKCKALKENP